MQTNNKLREALKAAKQYLDGYTVNILELRRKVEEALSAPARNCDVGTADEQSARMSKFCAKNGLCRDGSYRCENCALLYDPRCELAWAQMPYKEGGVE